MLNLLLEVSKPMTGSGANNRDVKKINRIRTIRSIFSCDRISQPELAAKVNNSWPTVLQNVKELMAMGLVQEVGTFESTGGRKARAFAPVRNARLAVGLRSPRIMSEQFWSICPVTFSTMSAKSVFMSGRTSMRKCLPESCRG